MPGRGNRRTGRGWSPRRGPALCPATGKIRYRDGHDAALALRSLRRRASRADAAGGQHTIRVVRKYCCPSCGGWHLTSQPSPGRTVDIPPEVPSLAG